MKYLLVTTHPLSNSLCKSLTARIVSKLKVLGHDVTIEDLYAQDFQAALTVEERQSYYTEAYDSSNIADYVIRLKQSDALVLVFPTWWFGFPALLKGWFDRVWGPGIAYDHASDLGLIKPRLDKLKKVLVVTTLGSPWWVDKLLMRQPVKRIVKTALLGTCAPKSQLTFLTLYKSEKLEMKQIRDFSNKVERALDNWR